MLCITASNAIVTPPLAVEDTQNEPDVSSESADIASLPLSELDSYSVGIRRNFNYVDASRNNREVNLTIWYPAERI